MINKNPHNGNCFNRERVKWVLVGSDLFFPDFFCPDPDFYLWEDPDKKKSGFRAEKFRTFFYWINLFWNFQYFSENIGRFQSILKVKKQRKQRNQHILSKFFSQPPSAAINNIISLKTVSNHGILATPTILSFFFRYFFCPEKKSGIEN